MSVEITLDLPDELVREIKLKAVREGRKFKDAVADLLRAGLAAGEARSDARTARKKKRRLPLVKCRHPATSVTEMTPERVADILLRQEASWHAERRR